MSVFSLEAVMQATECLQPQAMRVREVPRFPNLFLKEINDE